MSKDLSRLDYLSRVKEGKKIESRIMEEMNKVGYHVVESSPFEDMHHKIDAYMWFGQAWHSLQLKYRTRSTHIVMETLHFISRNGIPKVLHENMPLDGRDMTGRCEMYGCVISNIHLYVCQKREIHDIAQQMTRELLYFHCKNPLVREIRKNQNIVKICKDPCTQRDKILVMIHPSALSTVEHKKLWNDPGVPRD